MSSYAYEIGKEYTLDNYFVGEYNREVFSTIHNWVRKKSRNSILIVEGLSGVGKSHSVGAVFDKEGLREHVKVISAEVFLDLLIKKVSGRSDSYSNDKYEKTFEPSDFIVIEERNEKLIQENKEYEPAIGMTKAQVTGSTWGEPEKKNIDEYAWGVNEQWVYSGKGYIYFTDGIVTAIQHRD